MCELLCRRPTLGRTVWPVLALLLLAGGARADGPIRIEEVQIGYQQVYRPGHVTPVFVRVRNDLAVPFAGELVVQQNDDDGERLRWHAPVSVNPNDTAWWMVLMIPRPGAIDAGQVELSLLDGRGRGMDSQNLRAARSAPLEPGDARVVGVIGNTLGAMDVLNRANAEGSGTFTGEPIRVLGVPTGRLPVVWAGLDGFDVLYWDDPRPQDLSAEQQQALIEWVRRGGQLVVGLGSGAAEFASADSPLGRMLPVAVVRTGRTLNDLHPLGQALLGRGYGDQLVGPATVVQTELRSRAIAQARSASLPGPLLARWSYGAGSVTAMATTLRDGGLVDARWPLGRALAALLGIRAYAQPREQMSVGLTGGLGGHLDSSAVGGTLVGLVVLLSLLYALAAGPGIWLYLRFKNRMHLSWWAFGALVAVATVTSGLLSLVGIKSTSITQAVVVDLDAGSAVGVVRGHLGLYVPAHRDVRVTLGRDEFGLLTPMIDTQAFFGPSGGFPDVRTYDLPAEPGQASLDLRTLEVPIRRTIKRLRLCWQGDLRGTVFGQVRVFNEHDAGGMIRNALGVELHNAVLVYPAADTSLGLYVLPLGTLADGSDVKFDSSTLPTNSTRKPLSLYDFHRVVVRDRLGISSTLFGGFGGGAGEGLLPFEPLVTMLSTLELYDQPDSENEHRRQRLTRSALGRWDRSAMLWPGLGEGRALLIAEAPGYLPADIDIEGADPDVTGRAVVRVLLDVPLP